MSNSTSTHIPEIEYLRSVAIVMTLIAHATFAMSVPSSELVWFNSNIGQFWGGVEIFFCVSGYVISRQLLPKLDAAKQQGLTALLRELHWFYRRRAFRILPLAITWATFTLILSLFFNSSGVWGDPDKILGNYLAAIFFFENFYLKFNLSLPFSHYWSLAIEEQFYIFFPIIFFIIKPSRQVLIISALVLIQAILPRPVDQTSWLAMVRYDALMMGVLIFFLEKSKYFISQKWSINSTRIFSAILLLLVIVIPVLARDIWFFTGLLDICAALIVFIAARGSGAISVKNEALDKIIMWMASRSYGIYLAHIPVMLIWKEIGLKYSIDILPVQLLDLRELLILGLILVISEIMYRTIESPLREIGKLPTIKIKTIA